MKKTNKKNTKNMWSEVSFLKILLMIFVGDFLIIFDVWWWFFGVKSKIQIPELETVLCVSQEKGEVSDT